MSISRSRPFSALGPVLFCLFIVAACGPTGSDNGAPNAEPNHGDTWPPTFDQFAFTTDLVVVFPGTCTPITFAYATRPVIDRDDLEVIVDGGSMNVFTIQELDSPQPNGRTEGMGQWQICAGVDAPVEGSIRVQYRDHPEYFAEARLVQRNYQERLNDSPPALTLPLDSRYPSDLRWSDDGSRIEIADTSGRIFHVDPSTAIIERVEYTAPGDITLMSDTFLLSQDERRSRLIHRERREILSSVALWNFRQGDDTVGALMHAHGRGDRIAVTGAFEVGEGVNPAFVSTFDLGARAMTSTVFDNFSESRNVHFPHVTVSPDGEFVAWSALAAPERINEIYSISGQRGCEIEGGDIQRGQILPEIKSKPVFSNDSQWVALWATGASPMDFSSDPLLIYQAASCGRKAFTELTPPDFHRGGLALSSGATMLAAVATNELWLYDVPEGMNEELELRQTLAPIATDPLNAGTGSEGFSDRALLNRHHFLYPTLVFADDAQKLVSASTRGARIIAIDDDYSFVETPVIDPDSIEVYGAFIRVGIDVEQTSEGLSTSDLIYDVRNRGKFAYRLGDDEEFLGIDAAGLLYLRVDDQYFRRDLTSGDREPLGTDEPTVAPAAPMATVTITDEAVEVRR